MPAWGHPRGTGPVAGHPDLVNDPAHFLPLLLSGLRSLMRLPTVGCWAFLRASVCALRLRASAMSLMTLLGGFFGIVASCFTRGRSPVDNAAPWPRGRSIASTGDPPTGTLPRLVAEGFPGRQHQFGSWVHHR